MAAELGKGFPFLFVDFAVQLPAGFPGALRFGPFTRTAFDDPRRLPVRRTIRIGSHVRHVETSGNPDEAAQQEQGEECDGISCDHVIILPIRRQWQLPAPRPWWQIQPRL